MRFTTSRSPIRRCRKGPPAPTNTPASPPLSHSPFPMTGARMSRSARRVSREAGDIVAVSRPDADEMRRLFDVTRVTEIPTGVNIEYFLPPDPRPTGSGADLVFIGSMDWLPNVDGVMYFV